MKLSDFKKIKLKHGDPICIIWDDIVEHSNYGFKPDKPVSEQTARFIFMGWFMSLDKDKISVVIEPEVREGNEATGEHPFRTVQVLSVGDIHRVARLPKPRKWYC